MNKSKIKKLIDYSRENCEYYKEKYKNLEYEIPILTKEEIRGNEKKFISKEKEIQELLIERTSGTSGIPLYIYKSSFERAKQFYILWKFRKENFNFDSTKKVLKFHISKKNSGEIIGDIIRIYKDKNKISLSLFHLDEKNLDEIINDVITYNPSWIFGAPSAIFSLTKYLRKKNIKLKKIEYIEFTGEILLDEIKKYIIEYFNCSYSNQYGMRETYGIAMTCKYGNFHILERNVFVEEIKKDLIITSLNSYAMPFIRYNTGDKGKLKENNCKCKNKGRILKLYSGRETEKIYLRENVEINSSIFYYIFNKINIILKNSILSFQVIQKTQEKFYVNIEIKKQKSFLRIKEEFFKEIRKTELKEKMFFLSKKESIINLRTGKKDYFFREF